MKKSSLAIALAAFLAWGAGVQAQETSTAATKTTRDIEASQEKISEAVRWMAGGLDNFFGTNRHDWQTNETRVTVRGNVDYIDDHGWDFSPELKLHLVLPALDERLRLVVNDDDDDGSTSGNTSDETDSSLSLRYIGKLNKKWGISYDLGLSTRGDPTLQGFVRANLFRHYHFGQSAWAGRTENRLYYYGQSGWRNEVRQYFELRISDTLFFRSRTRFDYQEDKDKDWYPEQKFTLFHTLSPKTAVAYEAMANQIYFDDSPFDEDEILNPQGKYWHYQLRMRFRQNVKWPWLFYEIWPIAAWTEERDYEFTPAVRFRLEIAFGAPPTQNRLDE